MIWALCVKVAGLLVSRERVLKTFTGLGYLHSEDMDSLTMTFTGKFAYIYVYTYNYICDMWYNYMWYNYICDNMMEATEEGSSWNILLNV